LGLQRSWCHRRIPTALLTRSFHDRILNATRSKEKEASNDEDSDDAKDDEALVRKELGLERDANAVIYVRCEPYLAELVVGPGARLVLVRSGCGTGKSDQLCRLASKLYAGRRSNDGSEGQPCWMGLLGVSDRETLASAIYERFQRGYYGARPLMDVHPREVGVRLYNDEEEEEEEEEEREKEDEPRQRQQEGGAQEAYIILEHDIQLSGRPLHRLDTAQRGASLFTSKMNARAGLHT